MGGYRLVRKLGEGPRADVFLGYPSRSGSEAAPAAVKVFRARVSGESMMTEIESLTRAAGPHCVELVDLAGSPDGGSALILERLGGGSLARLLGALGSLRIGEAITVLGPLADTLSRMHEAGVAHCAVTAERVLFDADGAPVLAGFGAARLVPPGRPVALQVTDESVRTDYAALARLARSVLTLVRDESAHELAEWLARAEYDDHWLDTVSRRVYEIGDASAVDLAPVPATRASVHPARVITAPPVAETPPRSRLLDAVGAPEWVQDAVRGPVTRLVALARTVRPRVWITASAVAVALVCAIVLVPSSDSDATAEPPVPVAASETPAPPGPVTGDDPVAALLALWEERRRCIGDLSVLCLDAVDQANSSALTTDQELVRSLQSGGESPRLLALESSRLLVTESLGDTAIVALDSPSDSEPASILMMRSEAGWRIRDYLE
jgi:hypothetical protein